MLWYYRNKYFEKLEYNIKIKLYTMLIELMIMYTRKANVSIAERDTGNSY